MEPYAEAVATARTVRFVAEKRIRQLDTLSQLTVLGH
jgi:hypothetical protein